MASHMYSTDVYIHDGAFIYLYSGSQSSPSKTMMATSDVLAASYVVAMEQPYCLGWACVPAAHGQPRSRPSLVCRDGNTYSTAA